MKHSLNPDERIVSAFVPQDPYAIAPTFTLPPQLAETHTQGRTERQGKEKDRTSKQKPGTAAHLCRALWAGRVLPGGASWAKVPRQDMVRQRCRARSQKREVLLARFRGQTHLVGVGQGQRAAAVVVGCFGAKAGIEFLIGS